MHRAQHAGKRARAAHDEGEARGHRPGRLRRERQAGDTAGLGQPGKPPAKGGSEPVRAVLESPRREDCRKGQPEPLGHRHQRLGVAYPPWSHTLAQRQGRCQQCEPGQQRPPPHAQRLCVIRGRGHAHGGREGLRPGLPVQYCQLPCRGLQRVRHGTRVWAHTHAPATGRRFPASARLLVQWCGHGRDGRAHQLGGAPEDHTARRLHTGPAGPAADHGAGKRHPGARPRFGTRP